LRHDLFNFSRILLELTAHNAYSCTKNSVCFWN